MLYLINPDTATQSFHTTLCLINPDTATQPFHTTLCLINPEQQPSLFTQSFVWQTLDSNPVYSHNALSDEPWHGILNTANILIEPNPPAGANRTPTMTMSIASDWGWVFKWKPPFSSLMLLLSTHTNVHTVSSLRNSLTWINLQNLRIYTSSVRNHCNNLKILFFQALIFQQGQSVFLNSGALPTQCYQTVPV